VLHLTYPFKADVSVSHVPSTLNVPHKSAIKVYVRFRKRARIPSSRLCTIAMVVFAQMIRSASLGRVTEAFVQAQDTALQARTRTGAMVSSVRRIVNVPRSGALEVSVVPKAHVPPRQEPSLLNAKMFNARNIGNATTRIAYTENALQKPYAA